MLANPLFAQLDTVICGIILRVIVVLNEAVERAVIATRQLAKRQQTWLRRLAQGTANFVLMMVLIIILQTICVKVS